MATPKRTPDHFSSVEHEHTAKAQRSDGGDSSGSARRRAANTSRTGQACDRCKIRKIRCDARPGGCSPCLNSNADCRTTDRITGRATVRGHVESLESENAALRHQIIDLRRQLQERACRPMADHRDSTTSLPTTAISSESAVSELGASRQHDPHSLASILNPAPSPPMTKPSTVLPVYDPESVGDNYLGVASANDWPCPASGSSFSLFGMKLDLKDYVSNEDEDLARLTTYQSFFEFAYDQQCPAPPLPAYKDARVICEYFFKLGGSWLPILHKPDFIAMVDRHYNDPTFTMSDIELVQFHCLIALMQYQLKIRTRASSANAWSDHYRYAVSFWPKLIRNSDMQSIQTLLLIVTILRYFQRPGAYWIATVQVLSKVIEAGYHRSVRAWSSDDRTFTPHEIEMRKRLFWSVLQCHASLAFRLGRPLVVRLDDFDVEPPQALNDNLPEEDQLPEYRKCSFLAAIAFFKLLIIQLQIYSQLLSIRPPRQDYEQLQKRLNKQLDFWVSCIPSHLAGGGQVAMEDKAFALYLSFAHQGARLLLHHPAFLRKPNEALMKNDLDTCLDASSQLLNISKQLKALKFLDATWHNTTYYFNAIFTSLFAHSYRRNTISTTQLAAFKSDMGEWLEVMAEVGSLLGSGDRLPLALRLIIGTITADLTKHLYARLGIAEGSEPSATRAGFQAEAASALWAPQPQDHNTRGQEAGDAPSFNGYHRHSPSHAQDPYGFPLHATHTNHFNDTHYATPYQDDLKYRISLAQSALTTQTSNHQDGNTGMHQMQNPYSYMPTSYPQQPSRSAWDAFATNVSSKIQEPGQGEDRADIAAPLWASVNRNHTLQDSKSASPAQSTPTTTYASPGDSQQAYAWEGMPQNVISWQGSKEGGR